MVVCTHSADNIGSMTIGVLLNLLKVGPAVKEARHHWIIELEGVERALNAMVL